jgi:hypothetical protein
MKAGGTIRMARVLALLHHHVVPSRRSRRMSGLWQQLFAGWFDRYRPERHYMRGPGPKWREKHRLRR